jgi:hypothetical protein
MAVELVTKESIRKAGRKLVRFTRNTSYKGPDGETRDYGPDYEEDTVAVLAHEAVYFIAGGRAVEADLEEKKEKPDAGGSDDAKAKSKADANPSAKEGGSQDSGGHGGQSGKGKNKPPAES